LPDEKSNDFLILFPTKERRQPMYKKILVLLDGSKRAEKILPHVEELASRYREKVFYSWR
jgi:hypothetical protein